MALTQTQIIQSLGEALTWFERELSWGVNPQELRHLTGRIGELYTAMITRGQMALETNQRGYDVISGDNEKISVKTVTSSSHVNFNTKTFEFVDRVIVIRLNLDEDDGISVEMLLDSSKEEYLANYEGDPEVAIRFRTSNTTGRAKQLLSELRIVDSASFNEYEVRRYENDTVEVLVGGEPQNMAKPHLRDIAYQIGVEIDYAEDKAKNTRQLGAHVINKLNKPNK